MFKYITVKLYVVREWLHHLQKPTRFQNAEDEYACTLCVKPQNKGEIYISASELWAIVCIFRTLKSVHASTQSMYTF